MERRAIHVRGMVQGVGFRPYVFALASRLELRGFVRNETGAVHIEVEGEVPSLDNFLDELIRRPPPLARIEDLQSKQLSTIGDHQFLIKPSRAVSSQSIFISPDVATCDTCLAEMFDPTNRRYRYPFINCTHCGPRLTIITGAPYDRAQTTMAGFELCNACRAEYDDPANRRFHAEPIACAVCGPSLRLLGPGGVAIDGDDPLAGFASTILDGGIGAMKGLGGYHLVCDATSDTAITTLRSRKHREEKPLAVMVRDVAAASALCEVDLTEATLLASSRRPIVLLCKRSLSVPNLAADIAPGNPHLGVMLPYTPMHHLLMAEVDGRPLVVTSGNQTDEPIVYRDDDAIDRLAGIADAWLVHDRPIHVRCDDSVTRVVAGVEVPVRRSRGYAPAPITLPIACTRPTLAVGGQLKGTFALSSDRHAFISHHLGDLDHYEARRAFERDIALYEELFDCRPSLIVHDLHPDYASTNYTQQRAVDEKIPLLAVQHHHAHLASCLADNGLNEPAIGVTFDGTGYGTDGAVWGGEFLVGDYFSFERVAHLRYVGMPGGDRAIREPWRMAVAHLIDSGCDTNMFNDIDPQSRQTITRMLERRLNTPLTSSVGRLFDAVAAIAGVRQRVSYEGQAAIELEWLASNIAEQGAYSFSIDDDVIDTRPLIREVVEDVRDGTSAAAIARKFHTTVVAIVAAVCDRQRQRSGIELVALSGGVFLNALLTAEVRRRLEHDGFRVCTHRQVPPNDGGLSLGQLAIVAATWNNPGPAGHGLRGA